MAYKTGFKFDERRIVGWKYNDYTCSRAGPARGQAMGTMEVKRQTWRPAKAPAGPVDRH
jgi:hypothetical protein